MNFCLSSQKSRDIEKAASPVPLCRLAAQFHCLLNDRGSAMRLDAGCEPSLLRRGGISRMAGYGSDKLLTALDIMILAIYPCILDRDFI